MKTENRRIKKQYRPLKTIRRHSCYTCLHFQISLGAKAIKTFIRQQIFETELLTHRNFSSVRFVRRPTIHRVVV